MKNHLIFVVVLSSSACATEGGRSNLLESETAASTVSAIARQVGEKTSGNHNGGWVCGGAGAGTEFVVTYTAPNVPTDAVLTLHKGFGYSVPARTEDGNFYPAEEHDWLFIEDIQGELIAPGQYRFKAFVPLYLPSPRMDFAVRITLPNGQTSWDNGGRGPTSYYRASAFPFYPIASNIDCRNAAYQQQSISVVGN